MSSKNRMGRELNCIGRQKVQQRKIKERGRQTIGPALLLFLH